MDGVTVLNIVGGEIRFPVILVGTAMILLALIAIVVMIVTKETDGLVVASTIICGIGGLIVISNEILWQETTYEVTIDNSVSMVEFNEKYEVVELRGDIYVVKVRGDD